MIVVLAALAVAGCGEDDKIRATLDAEGRAWQRSDWDAACALRTEAARRDFCPPVGAQTTSTTLGNEPIVTFRFKERSEPEIEVDGDLATVRYESDGDSVRRLRKVDGKWLIDR